PPLRRRFQAPEGGSVPRRLPVRPGFVTVPRMPAPPQRAAAVRRARSRPRPRHRSGAPRFRRLAVLVVVVGALLGTLLVTAFSQGAQELVPQAPPPPAS